MPQPGFPLETDVSDEGTVTLKLPLPPGTPVEANRAEQLGRSGV